MSLVPDLRVFFVTKVSFPIPFVSTFHLQGLWAAASEEAARLRHFEAVRDVKKKPGSEWVKDNLGGGFKH